MTKPDDIDRIVAGLSRQSKQTLREVLDYWTSGPSLSNHAIDGLEAVEALNLAERQFMDEAAPRYSLDDDTLSIGVVACWHFRLTSLGLAVRQRLMERGETKGDG